jgi:hypothetical protein
MPNHCSTEKPHQVYVVKNRGSKHPAEEQEVACKRSGLEQEQLADFNTNDAVYGKSRIKMEIGSAMFFLNSSFCHKF